MSDQLSGIIVPIILFLLTVVVSIQAWIIRQVMSHGILHEKSSGMHQLHLKNHESLEAGLNRLETSIERGFSRVDRRLDSLETRCIAHLAAERVDLKLPPTPQNEG